MSEKELPDDFQEDETPWRPKEELLENQQNAPGQENPDLSDNQGPCLENENETVEGVDSLSDSTSETMAETSTADLESETTDITEPEDTEITNSSVVEAVLFATDEPVSARKLVEIVGTGGVKEIKQHIEELNQKYEQLQCSFRIENIAGGYQMLTLPAFNVWLRKLLKVRSETKLSQAALETLAIISYKQPIMRVEVEGIRGVACGEMIRQLCEKGLVKIVGRAEELGRPLLYGTTRKFLEVFGLSSLQDLPKAEDLKSPD